MCHLQVIVPSELVALVRVCSAYEAEDLRATFLP